MDRLNQKLMINPKLEKVHLESSQEITAPVQNFIHRKFCFASRGLDIIEKSFTDPEVFKLYIKENKDRDDQVEPEVNRTVLYDKSQ